MQSDQAVMADVGHVRQRLEDQWSHISSLSFAWRVLLWGGGMGAGWYLSLQDHLAVMVCGVVLLGVAIAHGVELQHQTLHLTGFRSRWLNRIVGTVLGLPALVSYPEYRITHLRHHRMLGTAEDREFFNYGGEGSTLRKFFWRFFMLPHYFDFFRKLRRALAGEVIGEFLAKDQPQIRRFYLICTALLVLAILTAVLSGQWRYLGMWICSLILIASPVHAAIELPEHYGCDTDSPSVFENTTSIRAGRFMIWLSNSNNYHVEHHLHPNVPLQKMVHLHHRYARLHRHVYPGYFSFYRAGIIKLLNRRGGKCTVTD